MDNVAGIFIGLVLGFFLFSWLVMRNSRTVFVEFTPNYKIVVYKHNVYRLSPTGLSVRDKEMK